jgi:hypothetical protein
MYSLYCSCDGAQVAFPYYAGLHKVGAFFGLVQVVARYHQQRSGAKAGQRADWIEGSLFWWSGLATVCTVYEK